MAPRRVRILYSAGKITSITLVVLALILGSWNVACAAGFAIFVTSFFFIEKECYE